MSTLPFSLWRQRDFVKLWAGQTISEAGSLLGALPYLALLTLKATPAQMGILETLQSIPALLFALLAGAWVDRLRRRPLLIAADLGRAVVMGIVPLLALSHWLGIGPLYAVAFIAGTLTVLFEVAHPSYLPAVVGKERLVEANSKLSVSGSVAEIVAPGLGGVLVQWIGAPLTVLLDAFSFLASALFLHSIRTPEPAPTRPEEKSAVWRDVINGLHLVVRDPVLRALVGSAGTYEFFGSFFGALYGLFVLRTLGLSPLVLGLLIGSGGIGALLGGLLVDRLARRFGMGPTMTAGLLAAGLLTLLIPLAGGPPLLAVGLLLTAQVLGDLGLAIYFILGLSLRQSVAPPHMLGRVNASTQFLLGGAATLGLFTGGMLGQFLGVRPAVIVAGIGIQLAVLWLLFSPVRVRTEDEGPRTKKPL